MEHKKYWKGFEELNETPKFLKSKNNEFPEELPALDLEGVCASFGAACSSGLGEPSPVLRAMYPDEPWRAECALRLSLGPETIEADVEGALAAITRVLSRRPGS